MLSESQTRELQRFAQRERVTLNTLVQGAWALLLRHYTGQRVVTFGATMAGRPASLPGVEGMLGVFINTLPVVTEPRAERRVGEWLRELQEHNLDLRQYEHTPLYDVQRWGGRSGQALFDTLVRVRELSASSSVLGPRGRACVFRHRWQRVHQLRAHPDGQ